MSATHQSAPPRQMQPQRKPTGASDRLLAGTQYGLHPGGEGVSDEPTSIAPRTSGPSGLERLTISPQSTLSAASSSTPPPLPPKVPPHTVPQYTTSRSGSVSVAPEPWPKHRVAAPTLVGQRPPSPPKQRRVPPPIDTESSPLTPPLTPRGSPRQRTASGSRPLPQLPQDTQDTPPSRSPQTTTSPSTTSFRGPLPESPQSPRMPRTGTHSTQRSPTKAVAGDAPLTNIPGPLSRRRRSSAEVQRSQPPIQWTRPDPPSVPPKGNAHSIEASRPDVRREQLAQTRAASIATEGPQTRHAAQSTPAPSATAVTVPPRAASLAVPTSATPSSAELEAAQSRHSPAPTPPPKLVEKQPGRPVPQKQASAASAPEKFPNTSSTASPTSPSSSQPPKPSTPTASASLPAPRPPRKDRPPAQPKDKAKAAGKESITKTSYLDPCLQKSLLTVPAAVTTTADAALSAVEAYPEQDFNWTIGAPIGGLGGLAKHYVLRPDAKFTTENGGISLTLAVVDERGGGVPSPAPTPGPDGQPVKVKQGRTKARVEVRSDRGGILIDLKELDANRQIDLLVETRKGDVLLLLPENFLGPIHVRGEEPSFGSILRPQLDEVVNPYEDLWTTNVIPLGKERGAERKNKFRAHKIMKGISKYVPEALREQDDYLDMAMSSYTTLKKGDQSKVVVKAEKGRVCVGMGGTKDARDLREGIKVGAEEGTKKHWWS